MRRRICPFGHFKRGKNQKSETVRDIHVAPHKLSISYLPVLSHLSPFFFPKLCILLCQPMNPFIFLKPKDRVEIEALSSPIALHVLSSSLSLCWVCQKKKMYLALCLPQTCFSFPRKNIEFWTFVNQIKEVKKIWVLHWLNQTITKSL